MSLQLLNVIIIWCEVQPEYGNAFSRLLPKNACKCIVQEERHKIKEGLTQAVRKQYEIKRKLKHNVIVVTESQLHSQ